MDLSREREVGMMKVGKYHGIIKKTYEDGSIEYETSFSDSSDLAESYHCLRLCIGEMVGLATDNPRVLTAVERIIGKENIIKELENGEKED